jgi:hypothetical protein
MFDAGKEIEAMKCLIFIASLHHFKASKLLVPSFAQKYPVTVLLQLYPVTACYISNTTFE